MSSKPERDKGEVLYDVTEQTVQTNRNNIANIKVHTSEIDIPEIQDFIDFIELYGIQRKINIILDEDEVTFSGLGQDLQEEIYAGICAAIRGSLGNLPEENVYKMLLRIDKVVAFVDNPVDIMLNIYLNESELSN